MSRIKILFVILTTGFFLSGCGSSAIKQRKADREKLSQAGKLFCEFIDGEVYSDTDVALNVEMAKKCDSEKSMTITNYRSPSEHIGVMYCCAMREKPLDPKDLKSPEKPAGTK